MTKFKQLNGKYSFEDDLQLDSSCSIFHLNYSETPLFNGVKGIDLPINSHIKDTLTLSDNPMDYLYAFNGLETNISEHDRVELWKAFWLEYVNAFDTLLDSLPYSIVTIFVGRQSIEIGIKYILLKNKKPLKKTHNLGELCQALQCIPDIHQDYLNDIFTFCELYSSFIEGNKAEYFRYPEYSNNSFFANEQLDIKWLSINFAIILCKLLHYTNLIDNE